MARIFKLNTDSRSLDPELVTAVRTALESDSLIIFPTDTIYGLGCNAFKSEAIERVRALKQRSADQPFSIHLGSLDEIDRYAAFETEREREYVEALLPGPFTLILNASTLSPPGCISTEGKVGIRVPDSEIFRKIYAITSFPLVGTSINRSGEAPLVDINAIPPNVQNGVDLIIATDASMTGESSSVIDITVTPPRVIRGELPPSLKL